MWYNLKKGGMNVLDEFNNEPKRYNSLNEFYRKKFGKKIFKISLDANFSCPNIDGKVGFGGCIYCSNSNQNHIINKNDDLVTQFNAVKEIMHQKWPDASYIGYFQANTNTYAPLDQLQKKYELILKQKNVVGLNISTRPDAISDEVLNYLSKLSKKTFLTVELGLQTIHPATTILINRCHSLKCFEDMVLKLKKNNINVVVHIINGLPYETKEMMLKTVEYLNTLPIDGIKFHMLHVLKNTRLAEIYEKEKFPILSKKEYIDILCDQIEILRPDVVIHRLTGDPFIADLIKPKWLVRKFELLNEIDQTLKKRKSYQGVKKMS